MSSPWHRGPERVCPWWLCRTFDNPIRSLFHKPDKIFSGLVKPGMTVLDAGCGMGYFSIGMARMLEGQGRVVAVDLQQRMLEALVKRARRAGVDELISTVQCTPESLGVEGPVDFALAFWMVHETPDRARFLSEIHSALRPGGQLLITEPLFHVSSKAFDETLALTWHAGFRLISSPKVSFSRTALLKKQ